MYGNMKTERGSRLSGLPRGGKAGSARLMPPESASLAAAGDNGLSRDLREWAHTPARIPWPGGRTTGIASGAIGSPWRPAAGQAVGKRPSVGLRPSSPWSS